jgi:hypothetical protein
MLRRAVGWLVDAAGRRPGIVLVLSLLFIAATWSYARKLELRSDFLELLPRDSPGFKAFEHQLGRVGGGATFLVAGPTGDTAPHTDTSALLRDVVEAGVEGDFRCALEAMTWVDQIEHVGDEAALLAAILRVRGALEDSGKQEIHPLLTPMLSSLEALDRRN